METSCARITGTLPSRYTWAQHLPVWPRSMMNVSSHPYDALTPDAILDAMEDAGFAVSGRLFALNSYENRVYQVGLDEGAPVIAKFYRPGRWTEEQVRSEEHTSELQSRPHLVCRRLLEKKNKPNINHHY